MSSDNKPNYEAINGDNLYRDSTDFRPHDTRDNGCDCTGCRLLRYGMVSSKKDEDDDDVMQMYGPNTAKILELAGAYISILVESITIDLAHATSFAAVMKLLGGTISDSALSTVAGGAEMYTQLYDTWQTLEKITQATHEMTSNASNSRAILEQAFGDKLETPVATDNDHSMKDFREKLAQWHKEKPDA